ncbi:hypothetical protein SDC9_176247 [bioreactor metagenome]|uniref:Uncharacterized protein n=1 Tax=bioreactor metagenome TaxID=1076179 RepID=A0A645GS81_9ZZZZ
MLLRKILSGHFFEVLSDWTLSEFKAGLFCDSDNDDLKSGLVLFIMYRSY